MKASDFMRTTLEECCGEVYGFDHAECQERVSRVRFVGRNADILGRGPSVLWWVSVLERDPLLDGVAPPTGIGFRIECRAETITDPETGAAHMLECVLERLAPHLIAIDEQSDEEDSPSQQRLDYFACVARVVLPEVIEVA